MELVATHSPFSADRNSIDQNLRRLLEVNAADASGSVQEAMNYAVLGSAQRIRPILGLRIARAFGVPDDITMRPALAVELLHCASLIIDDLPCMDDSPLRRNRPAVHVCFGESTAILSAFGLVALSARSLVEQAAPSECQELAEFQIKLLRALDCSGLIAGQALDLQKASARQRAPLSIIELKTVPLFTLAVAAGTLFADLPAERRAHLDLFGRDFGVAFQMTDDLLDGEEVDVVGLDEKLASVRTALPSFGPDRGDLEELVDYLQARVCDQVGQ